MLPSTIDLPGLLIISSPDKRVGRRRGDVEEGGPAPAELGEEGVELGGLAAYLVLEVEDDAETAAGGVERPGVGLEADAGHGLPAARRVEMADDLDDVAHAEETVGVHELPLPLRREERGEHAVLGAPPALVLARRAGLLFSAAAASGSSGRGGGGGGHAGGAGTGEGGGGRAGSSMFGEIYGRIGYCGPANPDGLKNCPFLVPPKFWPTFSIFLVNDGMLPNLEHMFYLSID